MYPTVLHNLTEKEVYIEYRQIREIVSRQSDNFHHSFSTRPTSRRQTAAGLRNRMSFLCGHFSTIYSFPLWQRCSCRDKGLNIRLQVALTIVLDLFAELLPLSLRSLAFGYFYKIVDVLIQTSKKNIGHRIVCLRLD